MIIASQKRKENIAEYLLYMWQVEDIIRMHKLEIGSIRQNIIEKFPVDDDTRNQMVEWYESLIDMMRREEVVEKGHLQMNKNMIGDLADLNKRVLEEPKFDEYRNEFYKTLPFIVELRAKSGSTPAGEIETCFNALYGVLMLRLQNKPLSSETANAIAQISKFVAMLAKYYWLDEHDKLFTNEPDK